MNKINLLKIGGLTLLATVAVYTQYRPEKTSPVVEAAVDSVSAAPQATAGKGVATKEMVQYAQGFSPQEAVEAREPFELTDKDSPLDVISTLLTAPFGAGAQGYRQVLHPPSLREGIHKNAGDHPRPGRGPG